MGRPILKRLQGRSSWRTRPSRAGIALAACIGVLVLPAAAPADEPQPAPGLEEALAHPPGMPPAPSPSAEGGATGAASEERGSTPLETGPLEALAGHGLYWGLSIVGADGGHPIRRPREFWLAFGTITEYGGEDGEEVKDEYAVLSWEAGCNEYDYRIIEATPTRLDLAEDGATLVGCLGRLQKEDGWLAGFFDASPRWELADGRLTLTARGGRIVLDHRRPRP